LIPTTTVVGPAPPTGRERQANGNQNGKQTTDRQSTKKTAGFLHRPTNAASSSLAADRYWKVEFTAE
jgi:hypothetical protein